MSTFSIRSLKGPSCFWVRAGLGVMATSADSTVWVADEAGVSRSTHWAKVTGASYR